MTAAKNKCPKCKHVNNDGWNFCSNCAYKNTGQTTSCAYHFVVMGSGGVGKSAVTIQFVNRQFEPKYDPTIEDRYQKVFEYKGVAVLLEILDTAESTVLARRPTGLRLKTPLTPPIGLTKQFKGFVLVYSITNARSLEALEPIRAGILRHKQEDKFVPMILVGNKCDLDAKREVESATGKDVAKQWGMPFLETSAKKDVNIQEVFHSLIDMLWEHGAASKKETKSSRCTLL